MSKEGYSGPERQCTRDTTINKNTYPLHYTSFQRMKVKSEGEVTQSCPTLSDPMDCSLPGASVHGIFQAEYWSGVPLSSYDVSTPSHILRGFLEND